MSGKHLRSESQGAPRPGTEHPARTAGSTHHDLYAARAKASDARVCDACGLVFHAGRWSRGTPPLTDVRGGLCPACVRVRDRDPAGTIRVPADFLELRDEVLGMMRNAAESDQGVIQYVLADDPDGKRTHVYRREANRPMGDQPDRLEDWFPAYVFCEDINSLNFEYWDDKQNDWRTEWRTTKNDFQPDRLPQRVKITLGVLDDEGDKHFYTTQTILFMQEKIDMSK